MQVLHCDNHILVVYKPGGVPVQADITGDPDLLTEARAWVGAQFHKPGAVFLGLVHRLDRPARGVLVFGRTSKGAARLSAQFRDHTVQKTYQAVVHGRPPADQGTLVHWLEPHGQSSRIAATGQGQRAELRYRLLAQHGPLSLLEIDLITGRKHQIRVQCSAIGCPLLGDLRHGAPQPLADRNIGLLAARLAFDHPTSQQRLQFDSPLPPGWPWQPLEMQRM